MTAPFEPEGRPRPAEPATTLTGWLRQRSDAELATLLRRRPDLSLPAPADLPTLASRVTVRASVQRAVDALDAFALKVLEAAVLLAGDGNAVNVAGMEDLLGMPPGRGLDELRELVLVWGNDRLVLVPTAREALGPYPAGLGRPARLLFAQVSDVHLAPVLRALGLAPAAQPIAGRVLADRLEDADALERSIAALAEDELELLDRLAAGPPVGTQRGGSVLPPRADPRRRQGAGPEIGATGRLLERGLLVPIDTASVELPREVALALREHPLGRVEPEPPAVPVIERDPAELDRLGTTAVLELLRLMETLGAEWTRAAPAQLRSGGVGVRDLRRTARALGLDESATAALVEVAAAAGLLNATHSIEPVYLPTPEFDAWSRRAPAAQWSELALGWLAMTRQPGLVNQRGDRDRLITPLSPEVERGMVPTLRRQVLDALADLPPGSAPRDRADVLARLAWQAPRRAGGQRASAAAILAEAELLGLTAAGGLAGYSRTLLAGARAVAEQVLDSALPTPVDTVLVQPDLTVVVPGPPVADLAAELALVADLESSGGANVYRVSEQSLRRALDAGRSGTDLRLLFERRSRTPVPQSLRYLIDDLARRHGALRTGAASAYLRCDDESLLTRAVADRSVAALDLRRLAPTVAISAAPVARVLQVLRDAGYAPAAESPDGQVIALDADPPRAPSRQPIRAVRPGAGPTAASLTELVGRIRSGDALTQISRRVLPAVQVPGVTSAATMATLRDAIRNDRTVLLGYAEQDGTATRRTVRPISMAGGVLRGYDGPDGRLHAFPLHRITAVAPIREDEG